MSYEKRKAFRRAIQSYALAVRPDRSILGVFAIADISDTGAQLKISPIDELPNEFDLVLSKNAKVQRRCAVVWRSEGRVGIRFSAKRTQ
jgi:PilZ domain